jgi:hypothetical protein
VGWARAQLPPQARQLLLLARLLLLLLLARQLSLLLVSVPALLPWHHWWGAPAELPLHRRPSSFECRPS